MNTKHELNTRKLIKKDLKNNTKKPAQETLKKGRG